ncbi:MAG: hypothetical protein ACOZNI_00725 [Myxococcota bacterium]
MLGIAAAQLVAYDEAPGVHAEHVAPAGEHAGHGSLASVPIGR